MLTSTTLPGLTSYGEGQWTDRLAGDEIAELAVLLDELGFDHILVPEHLVMHRDAVPNLGARWSHSLSAIGMIIGATRKIQVSALIVLPYHGAVELAKALATLDFLSCGRITLVAAVGYMQWEFDLVGAPLNERGKMVDEYLDAMIELWTADEPRFAGKFVNFEDIVFEPKPVQSPHLPIWLAGAAKATVRRIARVGTGWLTYNITRAQLPGMLDYLAEQPEMIARPRVIEIGMPLFEYNKHPVTHELLETPVVSLDSDAVFEQVNLLADLGTSMIRVDAALGTGGTGASEAWRGGKHIGGPKSKEEYIERAHWFAEEIMPEMKSIQPRRAVGV